MLEMGECDLTLWANSEQSLQGSHRSFERNWGRSY